MVVRVVAGIGEYREFQEPLRDGAVIELSLVENPRAAGPQFEVAVINGTTPSVACFVNIVVKNKTQDREIGFCLGNDWHKHVLSILPGQDKSCQINHRITTAWLINSEKSSKTPDGPLSSRRQDDPELDELEKELDKPGSFRRQVDIELSELQQKLDDLSMGPTPPVRPARSNRVWALVAMMLSVAAFTMFYFFKANHNRAV